jgi:uncharacterized protein (TIGR02147 family)
MAPGDTSHMRDFLQHELVKRCKSNPKYSLRAFARQLGMEPSFLSKVLRKQRNISSKRVAQLGQRLGMKPNEMAEVQKNSDVLSSFSPVDADQFQMIADWYHFAILELSLVKNFKPSIRWIAACLGISHAEAQSAVERLQRLGKIAIDSRTGKWKVKTGFTTTASPISTGAFRTMQKQILSLAAEKMESVPIEERDQSSMTMAIDSARIPEAKKMIKNFRRRLMRYLQSGKTKDDVYLLSISLFPGTLETQRRKKS